MVVFRWYTIPLVAVVLAAACWLSVWLANLLPAAVLPIQFTAGVALAALLVNGLRCWPGVFLGVYAVSLWLSGMGDSQQALFEALVISSQALVGALLVRPLLRGGLVMSRDGEVVRFLLLAGPVACLVSAASTQVALLPGPIQDILQPWIDGIGHQDWLTVWSANTLGVLVAAPPAMAFWPAARSLRRLWGFRVALPLILAGLLVVIGHVALFRFELREAELEDNARLESVLQGGLVNFDQSIEALHSVEHFFHASHFVSAREFAVFTARILRWPGLESIEWVPKVAAGRPLIWGEAAVADGLRMAADDSPDSTLAGDASVGRILAEARDVDYYPSLYAESISRGAATRGVDYSTIPSRWMAMEKARDSGDVTAAEPEYLVQSGNPGLPVFVPLYTTGFDTKSATPAERQTALRGFIKGNFDLTRLVEPLSAAAARQGVRLALVDLTPGSPPTTLLSHLYPDAIVSHRRHFSFAGRLFQLDMALPQSQSPGVSPVARLYQGFSVLALFLTGLAVLASAGRHSAAQATVLARTTALRASERYLEVTLDSIGDGVLVVDTGGFVSRLNPMAEQLTGWRSRLAQGRPVSDVFAIVNEQNRQPVPVPVADVLASGTRKGLANHTVLISRDGSECAIAHTAAPIVGADGEPLGVVLVFRDVNEEREAERALEASEQRYRELIEQAPYGIFVQTGGYFAYLNPTALRLLGARQPAELLGTPVLDALHPDSRELVAERIRQLNLLGMPSAPLEEKWLRRDGSVFHAEASAVPHVHDGVRGALVMLQDITARKAAETQRDRFFDLSLDPQCIVDGKGHFVRVNAACSTVLGWRGEEFLNAHYADFIHPEDRAEAQKQHDKILAGDASQPLEVRFRRPTGDWRWLSWSAVADDQSGLIYAVARDVTERRETIQALTLARHEAEYANRAKSAFLATMSHEIRTPMNAVVGLADVLSHSPLGEHDDELVRNIRVSARSLLRLIDDILDFSKIEAGRLELEQVPVVIEALVEDLCQALLPMARDRGVSLSLFVAPELPRHILGDDVRLRQLFNNLIGNAIKFSAAPAMGMGRVRVVVEPGDAGQVLQLTVTDNGIGMSRDTLDHIFQPFTQGELSTTRRYGGTGLGLAISKRLIDLMAGELHLDSREGQGTTVTVVLPLRAVPGEAAADPLPDLSGIACIVVDTPGMQGDDWQRYLRHAGAAACCVATLDAALAIDKGESDTRVVIIDLRASAHAALTVNDTLNGDASTRFVLVDAGRRARPRLQSGKVVTLDGNIPRRRQMLQAVAVAAGRVILAAAPGGDRKTFPARQTGADLAASDARILVVEDDEMNRKVITEQLRLLGYTADVAGDGATALALWRERHHDLIFTDLHMPVMDGYDFVRTLRSEEQPPQQTPVVALTANAMRGEDSRARACGLDDYLTKPVSLDALDAVLQHWLVSETSARGRVNREDNPAMVNNEVLNLAILRDFIGGDDARLNNFVADYRESATHLREEIFAARQQDDLPALASFAHRLKSSSRWVGAISLGDTCEALEKVASAANRGEVDDCLIRFAAVHDATLAAIGQHLRAVKP